MSRATLEQLRLPIGLLLLAVVAFVLFPRGDGEPTPTPPASIIAGEPGGAVRTADPTPTASPTVEPTPPSPSPTEEPTPEPTEEATPEPTEAPTPQPVAADGFTAEVLACRSISGSQCNGQLGNLPANASSFVALMRFTDANAGDTMNAILTGPAGTISGGGYTLQGSGDGYFYSTFQAGGLPAGDYVITATRNGGQVAVTSFRKVGG